MVVLRGEETGSSAVRGKETNFICLSGPRSRSRTSVSTGTGLAVISGHTIRLWEHGTRPSDHHAASTSFLHQSKYILPNPIPGVPFFGNSFQMPSEGQGPFATKLAKKTREMYTMKFGRDTWVFLNSRRVVTELLDKRAAIYSSRQNLPMANEIISAHKRLLLMPYGAPWRKQRKAMHQILNNTKQTLFLPFQEVESRALLHHNMTQPEQWWEANARFSNSVIMSVTYGVRSDLGDPDLASLLRNAEQFVPYLFPGQCLIDIFPWLLKAPIPASWQPRRWWGTRLQHATRKVYKKLLDDLLERLKLGTQKPCFMTELLDSNKDDFEAEECYYIGGTLIEAGSDTTRLTLNAALAAALGEVCGANAERLPNFSDMDQLPLIKGVAKESLRWKPVITETGIPHALTKDDEFLDEDLNAPTKGHLGFGSAVRIDSVFTKAPFSISIQPRSEAHRLLIQRECADAAKMEN
ncbi:cytochrome P450 [Ilyonectria destructans]|nr:cytochrome P450 [Ilyonectria destructans]